MSLAQKKCVQHHQSHGIWIIPQPWMEFNQKLPSFGIISTQRAEDISEDKPIKSNQNKHSSLQLLPMVSWIIHSIHTVNCKLMHSTWDGICWSCDVVLGREQQLLYEERRSEKLILEHLNHNWAQWHRVSVIHTDTLARAQDKSMSLQQAVVASFSHLSARP